MEVCTLKAKTWGNSLGIVIPKSIVEKEKITEGKEIDVFIRKKATTPAKTFGILKGSGLSGQECKDWARAELWNE